MLLDTLEQFFEQTGVQKEYFVAYSGGMDSSVLLTAVCELRAKHQLRVHALHVNHGISTLSQRFAEHCETICSAYAVPLTTQKIKIDLGKGESLEEVARKKRYEALQTLLPENAILLTAHHEDDQAETLLLQLFRGAGLRGLAAMPQFKPLGKGFLARPFLSLSKSTLVQYATLKQLCWIEDDSNQNLQLTRNFLRLQVIPLLKTRWPTIHKMVARTAGHAREAEILLSTFANLDLLKLQGSKPGTLSVKKIKELPVERQRWLLRAWIQATGFQVPSAKKLEHILKDLLGSRADKTPLIHWLNAEMRRYRDDLYLLSPCTKPLSGEIVWALPHTLSIPHLGTLRVTLQKGGIQRRINTVTVRFREGGEVVRLHQGLRHSLKNLFQSLGVPPWERARIPLIYWGDELIAAVGYFVAQHVKAAEDEVGFALEFKQGLPSLEEAS